MRDSTASGMQKLCSIVSFVVLFAVAICVCINPTVDTYWLIAIGMAAVGLYEARRVCISSYGVFWILLMSAISIIGAILCVLNLAGVMESFDTLLNILPVWALVCGAAMALDGYTMMRCRFSGWGISIICGLLSLVIGLLLLILPPAGILTMYEITGFIAGALFVNNSICLLTDAYI